MLPSSTAKWFIRNSTVTSFPPLIHEIYGFIPGPLTIHTHKDSIPDGSLLCLLAWKLTSFHNFEYMSCISNTACFLVNCTSLFPPVWMEQGTETAQSGLVRQSSIIELHPQSWTGPNLAHKASANQRPSHH